MGAGTIHVGTVALRRSLVCVMALASVAGAARADELQDLRAQAAILRQQNDALMRRIDEIGRRRAGPSSRAAGRAAVSAAATAPVAASGQAAATGQGAAPGQAAASGQGGASGTAAASGQGAAPGSTLFGSIFGGGTPGGGSQPGGQTATGGAPTATEARAATAAPAIQSIGGTPPIPTSNALTYLGVTLYGTVDLGVSYQTHATPLNNQYGPGLEYLISKNSNRSQVSVAPNALSYSNIGLKGEEPLYAGLSAVFNLQTQFVPTSGNIVNNVGAEVQNNGVALNRQSSNGDSTRAGQAFQLAYGGLSSPRLGTLTLGRQNSFTLDGVIAYDPLFASNGFSVIGYSGGPAGGGDTEDTRLDSSLKYLVNYGPVHAGAFVQFGGGNGTEPSGDGSGSGRGSYQFDVGAEFDRLDVDAIYSQVYDAVSASPLTAAQTVTAPPGSLAASISDNKAFMLLAKYKIGPAQLFVGYENILYSNPRNPLAVGSQGLNGYVLGVVNNTAYTDNKLLQVYWGGVRYGVTKQFFIDAAYYREHQNSYSGNGCTNVSLPTCRGDLSAYSLLANYRVTPRFDVYAGAMLSTVSNGFASGFINNTSIDPTVGARFSF